MSKRFPVPAFDRDRYKNVAWEAPRVLSGDESADLLRRAERGDASAYGGYVVDADDAFYDRFAVRGAHRHAVMCLIPPNGAHLSGRSWAWQIQRALIVDSLRAETARVLYEWTTPRPMNTRLGPDDGVTTPGGPLYVLLGNRYGTHWICNRTAFEMPGSSPRTGFSILSSSDDVNNDFHACNLTFAWD